MLVKFNHQKDKVAALTVLLERTLAKVVAFVVIVLPVNTIPLSVLLVVMNAPLVNILALLEKLLVLTVIWVNLQAQPETQYVLNVVQGVLLVAKQLHNALYVLLVNIHPQVRLNVKTVLLANIRM
jgi:hypothetical protein